MRLTFHPFKHGYYYWSLLTLETSYLRLLYCSGAQRVRLFRPIRADAGVGAAYGSVGGSRVGRCRTGAF